MNKRPKGSDHLPHETRVWWVTGEAEILSGRVKWKGGKNTNYLLHIRDGNGDLHKKIHSDVVFSRPWMPI